MNQKIILGVAIVIILGAAVTVVLARQAKFPEGRYSGPALPEKRPADLRVSSGYSAGMTPRGSSVFLSEKESYAETYDNGAKLKTAFVVTPAELDALYGLILANHFEGITWRSEMVYDGGGGSINVSWGTNSMSKSMGDGTIMDAKSQQAYKIVDDAISALVQKKLAALRQPFTISIDPAITAAARVHLSLDDGPDLFWNNAKGLPLAPTAILPGDHRLSVWAEPLDTTSKQVYESINAVVTISGHTSTLVISLKNGKLGYTLRAGK